MKIYEVVTGFYEDYRVEARFDNILDAEKFCAANNPDEVDFEDICCEEYRINEVEFNAPIKPVITGMYYAIIYEIDRPGTIYEGDSARYRISNRPMQIAVHYDEYGDMFISLPINRLEDISDEHVLEVAREEYAKYKAANKEE